jgi:hypothetical protein
MRRKEEQEGKNEKKNKEINFVQVKTPTLGCLSNHYTIFLFIRLKLHTKEKDTLVVVVSVHDIREEDLPFIQ